jgi:hypothetical protein
MYGLSTITTRSAVRSLGRARCMATASQRIGDTKVEMSLLEKGKYVNYQRIEDNLVVVRKRFVLLFCIEFQWKFPR